MKQFANSSAKSIQPNELPACGRQGQLLDLWRKKNEKRGRNEFSFGVDSGFVVG